jgi:hypothetical protein
MLLQSGTVRSLGGGSAQRLRFGGLRLPDGTWVGVSQLWLDDAIAFKLTPGCDTCQFLFERAEGASQTLSVSSLADRLTQGLSGLEPDIIDRFGELLPQGDYLPLLVRIEPRLVFPGKAGDYFSEEQVDTWGINSFWGLPEYPRTPYYRTFDVVVGNDGHFFEFAVPMVPPFYNDPDRVIEYRERLRASSQPTVVALSILEVRAPAVAPPTSLYYKHWTLAHFVLDGHHKLQAAAETSRPLQLLSLLSLANSNPTTSVQRVPDLRSQRTIPAPIPPSRSPATQD